MTMRNRKNIIVAFVLVACMLIGVGYAALVDSLEVDGTTTITKDQATAVFDSDVYFSSATALPKHGATSTTNTTSINSDNNDKVSFTVHELVNVGDIATFEYEITNVSDLDVNLVASVTGNTTTLTDDDGVTTNATTSYFEVNYAFADGTVESGGTEKLTVTVKLIEAIDCYTKGSFTITVTATSNAD